MSVEIKVAKLETEVDIVKEDVREIKSELRVVHSRINEGQEKVMDKLSSMSKESNDQHDGIVGRMNEMDVKLNTRIASLENWRLLVIGGAIVAGYLISLIPFSSIFG